MNQKFRIKLVAVVAALSGTAWSPAHAAQQDGAFYATPSPTHQSQTDRFAAQDLAPPPIVSPTQAPRFSDAGDMPPIVSATAPEPDSAPTKNLTGMLSPLVPSAPSDNRPSVAPTEQANNTPLPTNIALATMAPVDATQDNSVAPTAQWQRARAPKGDYLNAGFSTAGVPLYANRAPQQEDAPMFGSGESVMADPIPSGPSDGMGFGPPIAPSMPTMAQSLPGNGNAPTPMQPDLEIPSYQSATPTYFDAPPTAAPTAAPVTGCQSCATGGNPIVNSAGTISPCQSCGPGGCYNQSEIDARMGYFGAMSKARRYYEVDALFMNRTDGHIVLSNFGGVGSFDGGIGWRVTLGERRDATQGYEFSYLGTAGIDSAVNRTDAAGRLSALFTPSAFYASNEAAPFFNAEVQNERKESFLHSFELNRVHWGWDVVKSFVGLRYIYVDDSYDMFSQRRFPAIPPAFPNPGVPERIETGNYRLSATNNLLGAHVGRELFYDVGYRLSFSALGKAGLFANINQFKASASNTGVEFLKNKDDNATLSTVLELNLTAHYQLNRRARLRVGYQGLFLDNMATVSDNLSGTLSPFLGSSVNDSDSMYFHGINIGFEFYR